MADEKLNIKITTSATGNAEIDKVQQKLGFIKKMDADFQKVLPVIGQVTAAITGVGAALGAATLKAAQFGSDMQKLNAVTGISKTNLQELKYIADQNKVSFEGLANAMKFLSRNTAEAATGVGPAADAFRELGISANDAGGNLKSTEQIFNEVVSAMGDVGNEAKRTQLLMDLFGRSGADMAFLMEQGAEGIEEARKRFHELGVTISDDGIDKLNDLGDAWATVMTKITGETNKAILTLEPAISSLIASAGQMASGVSKVFQGLFFGADVIGRQLGGSGKPIWETMKDVADEYAKQYSPMAGMQITQAGASGNQRAAQEAAALTKIKQWGKEEQARRAASKSATGGAVVPMAPQGSLSQGIGMNRDTFVNSVQAAMMGPFPQVDTTAAEMQLQQQNAANAAFLARQTVPRNRIEISAGQWETMMAEIVDLEAEQARLLEQTNKAVMARFEPDFIQRTGIGASVSGIDIGEEGWNKWAEKNLQLEETSKAQRDKIAQYTGATAQAIFAVYNLIAAQQGGGNIDRTGSTIAGVATTLASAILPFTPAAPLAPVVAAVGGIVTQEIAKGEVRAAQGGGNTVVVQQAFGMADLRGQIRSAEMMQNRNHFAWGN